MKITNSSEKIKALTDLIFTVINSRISDLYDNKEMKNNKVIKGIFFASIIYGYTFVLLSFFFGWVSLPVNQLPVICFTCEAFMMGIVLSERFHISSQVCPT